MKKKGFLAGILSFAMTISVFPTFGVTVSAEDDYKNFTLGASALQGGQESYVYYGNYQQTSAGAVQPEGEENVDWIQSTTATQNGQGPYYNIDPIRWQVLSKSSDQLFLISDKSLDAASYNNSVNPDVTWAKSTIRSWLNGYSAGENTDGNDYTDSNFIDSAFNEKEQTFINDTGVVNDDNIDEGTSGGIDTTDKVFLLSISEAKNGTYFFWGNDGRKAYNTDYVAGKGMSAVSNADCWWLRSPGGMVNAAFVSKYGTVDTYGQMMNATNAIRPAINLDTTSVLFTSAAKDGTENCYYDNEKCTAENAFTGVTAKSSAQFESGEVCYLLNGGKTDGAWKQTLGTDMSPNFNGKTVYLDGTSYTNEKPVLSLSSGEVAVLAIPNSAKLILASYNGERLVDAKIFDAPTTGFNSTISASGLATENATEIKAFLWDNLTDLNPLCAFKQVMINNE